MGRLRRYTGAISGVLGELRCQGRYHKLNTGTTLDVSTGAVNRIWAPPAGCYSRSFGMLYRGLKYCIIFIIFIKTEMIKNWRQFSILVIMLAILMYNSKLSGQMCGLWSFDSKLRALQKSCQ
jgi:hypothetical protein